MYTYITAVSFLSLFHELSALFFCLLCPLSFYIDICFFFLPFLITYACTDSTCTCTFTHQEVTLLVTPKAKSLVHLNRAPLHHGTICEGLVTACLWTVRGRTPQYFLRIWTHPRAIIGLNWKWGSFSKESAGYYVEHACALVCACSGMCLQKQERGQWRTHSLWNEAFSQSGTRLLPFKFSYVGVCKPVCLNIYVNISCSPRAPDCFPSQNEISVITWSQQQSHLKGNT